MSTITRPKRPSIAVILQAAWESLQARIPLPKLSLYGLLMIGALLAFESFNFGTTQFALSDLLGDLSFAGLTWSTILALAFCGMDIAGIVRLFTADREQMRSVETWYLLAAWLLAATMNAALTWWAVSLALLGHSGLGNEILGRETLIHSVPVFVAILVWLLRILILGTFSMAGLRWMTNRAGNPSRQPPASAAQVTSHRRQGQQPLSSFQPAPNPMARNGTRQQRQVAARPHRSL